MIYENRKEFNLGRMNVRDGDKVWIPLSDTWTRAFREQMDYIVDHRRGLSTPTVASSITSPRSPPPPVPSPTPSRARARLQTCLSLSLAGRHPALPRCIVRLALPPKLSKAAH